MVSYYNHLQYTQKHSANLPYQPSQSWFSPNYPPPPNAHLFSDVDHQHVYYSPQIFHQTPPEWQTHENYPGQQAGLTPQGIPSNITSGGGNSENLTEGLPSPPITVSGSEMSSPGVPNGASSPHAPNNASNSRPTPDKSPFYDWMKKPSYPAQPNPGKTRTKDKYRVVYTDFQRLELEKEYHTSRYITIRRKTELAQALQLSERQVKIWFQNRRAKERKQNKKRDDPLTVGIPQHSSSGIGSIMDSKPKLEPGLHLPHSLHQMSSMAMGMSHMGLHPSVLHHSHLSVPPPPPPSHNLHQSHQQSTASIGALTM
ncbi:homeotic protein caudal isoform X2 [Hermetia illucens]|uniref:homeotic protein caudal isoform X2 n=1 Tax=Hermetia illucens TaxID=343691 RepID=UPI0018CC03ED|nr:homeotic protein caudal isoform X2 [Hermetia illucens]